MNTVDVQHGLEWLAEPADLHRFAAEYTLADPAFEVTRAALRRTHELREALRTLLVANNGGPPPGAGALDTLNDSARRARLTVQFGRPVEPRATPLATGVEGVLGQLVALTAGAIVDGTWIRLKACRNCRWAFYDRSRNRSATWCSMILCGNRLKTRAYRSRRATG